MTGSLFRQKWFRVVAILVVVVVVVALLLPLLISVDHFRPRIVSLIEENTGRQAEIGEIRLRLFPSLQVEVLDFHLKNPANFPEDDTLAVERIAVGAEFWPLLDKQLKVTSVALDGVTVHALENQYGSVNYDLGRGAKKAQKAAEAAEESPAFTLGSIDEIAVTNVRVSAGRYNTRSRRTAASFDLSGVDTTVKGLDIHDPDLLKNLDVAVELNGATFSTPAFKEPLQIQDGGFEIRKGSGEGRLEATLGSIAIRGDLRMADLAHPRAQFSLELPELDLMKLAALTGGSGPGTSPAAEGAGGQPAERRLLASGRVKIGKLLLPPLQAENLDSRIRLYTHKIEVDPLSLDFYRGKVEGTALLDQAAAGQPLTINAKLGGVDVAELVRAVAPDSKEKITGTLAADARLTTQLTQDPAATLQGQGQMALRDGVFPGLDLQSNLGKLVKFLQMNLPAGDTKFSYMGGDFRIEKKRVNSQKLRLEAENLEAELAGSFGFDGTLDYRGSGVLDPSVPQPTGQQSSGETADAPQEQKSLNPLARLRDDLRGAAQQAAGQLLGTGPVRIPFAVKGTMEEPKISLTGAPQRLQRQPQP